MKATPVPKAEPFADSRDIWLGEIDGDKEQLCLKVSYHGTSSVAKAIPLDSIMPAIRKVAQREFWLFRGMEKWKKMDDATKTKILNNIYGNANTLNWLWIDYDRATRTRICKEIDKRERALRSMGL